MIERQLLAFAKLNHRLFKGFPLAVSELVQFQMRELRCRRQAHPLAPGR